MRISTAAAIALAEEIKRRAAGPDHMAFDAVTWRDLGRILEATERWSRTINRPDGGGPDASSRSRSSRTTAPAGGSRRASPLPGGATRSCPDPANDRQSHPGRDTFTGVLNGPRNPPNCR